ncbi:MAG: alpha/beta hydrolase [Bacteroidetes bacterium]|nr:alpha/beta hydrolase [Bacteroidota bacterium]
MKPVIALIAVALFFASCRKDVSDAPAPLKAETTLNTPYGADPLQKMDIYLPAGRTAASTKVIIMIHGGGWTQGDKTDFTAYVDTLKKRLPGYAIFNINYRLATRTANFFPAQENDVKQALEFIFSKRNEYNISDKFVLLGASAGGHLALLHAYKYTSPVKIKAVVDFFGPTELVNMYNNPPNPLIPLLLIQVTGGNPTTHATIYQQSSPMSFVTSQSPPTIILHGGTDIVVAPSQSVLLKNQLQTLGVTHQYVYYSTEGHGWTGPNLVDSFEKITAFINANVN